MGVVSISLDGNCILGSRRRNDLFAIDGLGRAWWWRKINILRLSVVPRTEWMGVVRI
jgi:hypothetical protein